MLRFLVVMLVMLLGTGIAKADTRDTLAAGGVGGWLNTEKPLTRSDLEGRVILLDFWTYGCINCMQIVPDLEALEQQFGSKLLIIGVHSAKFKGEQGNSRILAAAQRFGLNHPVINDADFSIWKSFGVKAWPTQILLDPQGNEIARYSGEGHRAEIARDIAKISVAMPKPKPSPIIAQTNKDTSPLWFPARIVKVGARLYIADSGHNRIVAVDETGKIEFVIGSGSRGMSDGSYSGATFNAPRGMDVRGDVMLIADTGNHALRRVDLKTESVTTVAGNGTRGQDYDVEGERAKSTLPASPWDVKFSPDGQQAIIAMAGLHQLWRYDLAADEMGRLAGTGGEGIVNSEALSATLAQPSGLGFGGIDYLYFVDAESSSLRAWDDGKITTLIGTGLFDFGLKDGTYPEAQLQHPQGLSVTPDKVYIADTYNNAIRIYDRKSHILSTLKLVGDSLSEPSDIWVEENTAYIADTGHHQIKKVNLQTGKIAPIKLSW